MSLPTALRDPATGTNETPVHELAWGLVLWAGGKATRAQIIDRVPVPAHAHADLDALAAAYNAKTSVAAKAIYVLEVEAACGLYVNGRATEAEWRTLVEIP